MSIGLGPKAVTTGLIYSLDAGNQKSYNYNLASYTNNFSGGWGWNATAATGQNDPFNGTNAIKITATNTDPYGQTNSALPYVYAGRTYNYSMWMKGEGTAIGKNFTLALYDGTTWVSGSWGTNYVITAGWQRISQTFTPANSGSAQMRLDCPESGTPAVGDVCYLYGLQFTEGSSLLPYVSNSSTATPTTMFNQANTSQTATMTNGVAWSNGIMTFDGSNDYVSFSSGSPLGNANRSLFCWVKTTTGSTCFMSTGTAGNSQAFNLVTYGSNKLGVMGYNNDFYPSSGANILDGNWHYVGATFDGTTVRTYVDGVQDNSQAMTYATTGQNNFIGKSNHAGAEAYTNGQIALAQLYSNALTAAQVKQNFNATRGRFGL